MKKFDLMTIAQASAETFRRAVAQVADELDIGFAELFKIAVGEFGQVFGSKYPPGSHRATVTAWDATEITKIRGAFKFHA